jgi:hypothetical protein
LSSRKGNSTPSPVSLLGDGLQAALASTNAPYDFAPDPTAARASVESVMQQGALQPLLVSSHHSHWAS